MPTPLNIGTGRALLGGRNQDAPALWLQRGGDLFADDTTTTHPNVGDPVGAWQDRIVLARATQATADNRPVRTADNAVQTDGNDWLSMADRSEIRQRPGFTVAVWWYNVGTASGLDFTVVGKTLDTAGNREWDMRRFLASRFWFSVYDASGVEHKAEILGLFNNLVPLWHLIVGVINTDNTLQVYQRGALAAVGSTTPTTLAATAAPMQIGRGKSSAPNGVRVGDVRIWHRALGGAEIGRLWESERGFYGV